MAATNTLIVSPLLNAALSCCSDIVNKCLDVSKPALNAQLNASLDLGSASAGAKTDSNSCFQFTLDIAASANALPPLDPNTLQQTVRALAAEAEPTVPAGKVQKVMGLNEVAVPVNGIPVPEGMVAVTIPTGSTAVVLGANDVLASQVGGFRTAAQGSTTVTSVGGQITQIQY
jgi:hypothetical protein